MRNQYSTLDICKVLNITRERLQDWMNRGFVKPSIQTAKGQGTKSLFSRNDVYGIALFKKFLMDGFKRDIAATMGKCVTELFLKQLKNSSLLIYPFSKKRMEDVKSLYKGYPMYALEDKYLSKIDKIIKEDDCDHVLIVNFKKIRDEVDIALLTLEE